MFQNVEEKLKKRRVEHLKKEDEEKKSDQRQNQAEKWDYNKV